MSVRGVNAVRIREHKIPSAASAPYICVEGPDDNLWFCESGADKIAASIRALRTFVNSHSDAGAMPIGIVLGHDGNLWFAQKKANQDRPSFTRRRVCRIHRPDTACRSRRHCARPRRQRVVFRNRRGTDRLHHARRKNHRVQRRHHTGQQAVVDRRARRRSMVQRGRR